jgi:DNA anti-recombination protein RmuC
MFSINDFFKGLIMEKTKVDDILLEMIAPKIKEIEEKFSKGGSLTQDDINTLLLKAQYNHINHLDQKLNEVTADVASLKGEFNTLKAEINERFARFEGEMNERFARFEGEMNERFVRLEGEFNTKFAQLETKFEQSQVKMQQTIITTMKWYIGGAGIVLVLLKALDIFIK